MGRDFKKTGRKVLMVRCRTDNSVKNHFYSTLRRGMRKLNRFIAGVKGNYKSMNSVLLSKIVNVADDKFEAKKMADVTD